MHVIRAEVGVGLEDVGVAGDVEEEEEGQGRVGVRGAAVSRGH